MTAASRKEILELHIRQSLECIKEREAQIWLSGDPGDRLRARAQLAEYQQRVDQHLEEYARLCQELAVAVPEDIVQIIAEHVLKAHPPRAHPVRDDEVPEQAAPETAATGPEHVQDDARLSSERVAVPSSAEDGIKRKPLVLLFSAGVAITFVVIVVLAAPLRWLLECRLDEKDVALVLFLIAAVAAALSCIVPSASVKRLTVFCGGVAGALFFGLVLHLVLLPIPEEICRGLPPTTVPAPTDGATPTDTLLSVPAPATARSEASDRVAPQMPTSKLAPAKSVTSTEAPRPWRTPPPETTPTRPFPLVDPTISQTSPTLIVLATPSLELAVNAQLASSAFDSLNRHEYRLAVEQAQRCIDSFEQQAFRDQQDLEGSPTPPCGPVDEAVQAVIQARGVLNDVATCYFIKGQALERLGRIVEAREAYRGAMQFPYARTWDPLGFFWSPAQAATDRLERLSE